MSTKSTIEYGDNFHFYNECFDNENVYLELNGFEYECCNGTVTVQIPAHVWLSIQRHKVFDLWLAEKTDAELLEMVSVEVDKRIQEYQEAKTESSKAFVSLVGCIGFGSADSPKDEQVAKGMTFYKALRENQQQIISKMSPEVK